ncbi:Mnn11p [Sugiyamaella lignohabitans]|uniref:Mnn11p n=1 Tax=Sugiyamaella lignohabitans TaxID=796027 RepID=A0A167FZP4_9ASCO|nr:Mnn11p [Sugiyamaella lignohabitans]ANB15913.1 Mnn11p [Sugiyamaella lignohabitans]
MHSALPQSTLDGRFHARKPSIFGSHGLPVLFGYLRSPVARSIGVILGFFFTAYLLIFAAGGPGVSSYKTYVRKMSNGAETVMYSTSPYITPDITRLAEYRTSQYVTLADGKIVDSRKHAILYNGPKPGPQIVLVIGLDSDAYSQEYLNQILEDRKAYAKKHGYGLYARYIRDYVGNMPGGMDDAETAASFGKVFLIREAMYAFKDCKWVWWLDQDAVIMNHDLKVESDILDPAALKELIIRDAPILPPSSVVHTYKRVPAEKIRLIVTQNDRGISTSSFLVSNDQIYGHILIGYWMDPLQRGYQGFNDNNALNRRLDASLSHMVQWHPAILSRMAVIPRRTIASSIDEGDVLKNQQYAAGDFVKILRSTNEEQAPPLEKLTEQLKTALKERTGLPDPTKSKEK